MIVQRCVIKPGHTYSGRRRNAGTRTVVAIGPEHLPPTRKSSMDRDDGIGVLFVLASGSQGRATLASFSRWADAPVTPGSPR
jgi:hypothetical protein